MNDVNEKQFVSQTNSSVNSTKAETKNVEIEKSDKTISVNHSSIDLLANRTQQHLGKLSSDGGSDFLSQDQGSLVQSGVETDRRHKQKLAMSNQEKSQTETISSKVQQNQTKVEKEFSEK